MVSACDGCHSFRDWTRFGGPVIESGRGSGVLFPPQMGLPGRIASRNITPHKQNGIGAWSDGEKLRAFREGRSRDGSALHPMMPYERFRHMSDEDAYCLVAYLNTLPAVDHKASRSRVNFPAFLMNVVPRPAGRVPAADRHNHREYGRYLATLAGCGECHTDTAHRRMPLAGGRRFCFPGAAVSANLTPELHTGIGRWFEQDLLDHSSRYLDYAGHGSTRVGPASFTVMPWLVFSRLSQQDLAAIYTWLRTQPPVYHFVNSHPRAGDSQRR